MNHAPPARGDRTHTLKGYLNGDIAGQFCDREGAYLELSIVHDRNLVAAAHKCELMRDENGCTLVECPLDAVGEHVLCSMMVHSPV